MQPTSAEIALPEALLTHGLGLGPGLSLKGGDVLSQIAYKEATSKPIPELADELQKLLGQRLVAYGAGVSSPKLVGRWAAGDHVPREDALKRMRSLYRVVLTLQNDGFGEDTIRSFVVGDNPDLGERTPLDVIREGLGSEAVRAAEAFVS